MQNLVSIYRTKSLAYMRQALVKPSFTCFNYACNKAKYLCLCQKKVKMKVFKSDGCCLVQFNAYNNHRTQLKIWVSTITFGGMTTIKIFSCVYWTTIVHFIINIDYNIAILQCNNQYCQSSP